MDAVHAVITVSAHPAVGTATQHKFKAGSDTRCSHRQHLSKAGGFANVVKQTHITKAGQSHKQCNYAKASLLKKQRLNSERDQDFYRR